jgi:hypothetical protein
VGFGRVEALPRGIPKAPHDCKEGVHLAQVGKEGLEVVGILVSSKLLPSHWNAKAAGPEEAEEGLANEKI